MIFEREEPGCETIRVPVLKVFDGDGFLTALGNRQVPVRFGFTDAPEMDQPGGKESRNFLHSLIFDRWIEIAVLLKSDTDQIFDRHGRIVCVPYISDQNDLGAMRNVELEMVVNGWTWVLDRYGPEDRYFEALADARRNRRGIWALNDNVHPWEFKRQKYRTKSVVQPHQQSDLLLYDVRETACPQNCGGKLVKRIGQFGAFFGCSNYPRCRHSVSC